MSVLQINKDVNFDDYYHYKNEQMTTINSNNE